MKTNIFLFLGLLYASVGYSQTTHVLSFKVYEDNLANSVADANVEVQFENAFVEKQTDSRGICNFPLVNKGWTAQPGEEVKVTIYKKGYPTKVLNYTIQKNANRASFNFSREPTITIIGYINDASSGSGLVGVTVSYLGDYRTTTLDDGFFQLDIPTQKIDETRSTLVFSLQKEGYQSERIERVLPRNQQTIFIEHALDGGLPPPPDFPFADDLDAGFQWLTQNVDIQVASSWCFEGDCTKGRLYTWEAAKKACEELGPGWRLPTVGDWERLAKQFGGFRSVICYETGEGNPKEAYEKLMERHFITLSGYKAANKHKFSDRDKTGYYWTANEGCKTPSRATYFSFSKSGISKGEERREVGMACRCVRASKQ